MKILSCWSLVQFLKNVPFPRSHSRTGVNFFGSGGASIGGWSGRGMSRNFASLFPEMKKRVNEKRNWKRTQTTTNKMLKFLWDIRHETKSIYPRFTIKYTALPLYSVITRLKFESWRNVYLLNYIKVILLDLFVSGFYSAVPTSSFPVVQVNVSFLLD